MNYKKRLLIVTPYAVHDKVSHAGGKTINFYLKYFNNDEGFDTIIAYTGDKNADYELMVHSYGAGNIFTSFKEKNVIEKALDFAKFFIVYPFLKIFSSKYFITNNFTKSRLTKLAGDNFQPDIIIVESTGCIYWIDLIKNRFNKSFTVASCHDVSFLLLQRHLSKNKNFNAKSYYKKFKEAEINALNKFDLVVTHNVKDKNLLENEKIFQNEIHVISAYYDTYTVNPDEPKDAIVFFGSMGRVENIEAVEWIIANIWTNLNAYFEDKIKFVIVGGGMDLKKRKALEKIKNVEVTGFIDNPESIFSTAICLVAPLHLGAGIKVKVLEAMSSGIPVVTNQVGIEGIPAIKGSEYIHGETADEFFEGVVKLKEDSSLRRQVAENAKKMIAANFNLIESYRAYREKILDGL